MKILLVLSLIVNAVLGYFLMKKEKPPVMEKLIIETHAQPEEVKRKETRAPVPQAPLESKEKTEKESPLSSEFTYYPDDPVVQEAGERMERLRKDFLMNELQIPEEVLSQHEQLRLEFYQEQGEVWKKYPGGELPIEVRRELLDKEEAYLKTLEELYGKKNWQRYNEFRNRYNKRNQSAGGANEPFLFMGI